MSNRSYLILKTGLLPSDPIIDAAKNKLPNAKIIDLKNAAKFTPDGWDKVMQEILAADHIFTI